MAEEKEGIDLEASYTKDDADSEDEEKDEEASEGSDSDSEDSEEGGDEDSSDDPLGGGMGDLMDIFAEEAEESDSTAGLFQQFLEDLTMDQVSDEADRLLEEFRAI
tara:strand:+ start:150 stop:467 length:318 start_codon:yes stop_codon:yes gene_type:complete